MFARPNTTQTRLNHAITMHRRGQLNEAENIYRAILQNEPKNADVLHLLGMVHNARGEKKPAEDLIRQALDQNPNLVPALNNLGNLLKDTDRPDEALTCFKRAVELDPEHVGATQQLAALTGDVNKAGSEPYVRQLFDEGAAKFEKLLVDKLNYISPTIMQKILITHVGKDKLFEHFLDLGCGTGLMAEHLTGHYRHSVGVDLSSKMIEIAKKKKIYTELLVDDIFRFFDNTYTPFDLIIGADVFVYIADLEPIFEKVSAHSTPGALFLFSTEISHDANFQVNKAGRMEHRKDYLESLAKKTGFKVVHYQEDQIRLEKKTPVMGHYFMLEKKNT